MKTPWQIEDMKIVVVGAARTGRAAARFLSAGGARVTLIDRAPEADFPGLPQELESLGVQTAFGPSSEMILEKADGIVLSPGVPLDMAPLQRARGRGIPIVAELELTSWFLQAPIIAITGTNGKSTTTTLVGDALTRWGRRVFVGGNIGNPLINALSQDPEPELVVAEVSSFQLEGSETVHPRVAVLLNITEDHLERHPTMELYRKAKARIFQAQNGEDVAVINLDDPEVCRAIPPSPKMEIWGFSMTQRPDARAYAQEGTVRLKIAGKWRAISLENPLLNGPHGAQNMMATGLVASALGCPLQAVEDAAASFAGLPHRMEWIGEHRGVRFINDSKATNVGAAIPALESCETPAVLIAGGKDKGIDFSSLRDSIQRKARAVVLLGEAAARLSRTLKDTVPLEVVNTMSEAVETAVKLARPGDIVLLSPACSSFDQYQDYEERGDDFKAIFRRLAQTGSS